MKQAHRKLRPWVVVGIGLSILPWAPSSASAQTVTVLDRIRLGGYAEAITLVDKGPLAKHIVFVDGYEVWGIPGQGQGKPKARKLFDLRGLPIRLSPRGIAYVESEKLFLVTGADPPVPGELLAVDHRGRPGSPRTIQYLGGYVPFHLEGLSSIPESAGQFPDHLVLATWDADQTNGRLHVMDRAGNVVKEIFPNCPGVSFTANIGHATYLPGDRLLLSFYGDNLLCTIDFDGNASSAPTAVAGFTIGEGVQRLPDGRIVALAYPQRMVFFDQNLDRLPADDRNDVIGLGLNQPYGVAWDSDSDRHLVSHAEEGVGFALPASISAVPVSLDSSTWLVDLAAAPYTQALGMTYLSDEGLIAVAHRGLGVTGPQPQRFRGLLFWDTAGVQQPSLDLSPERPSGVTYIPGASPGFGRFAVRHVSSPSLLHILDRGGALLDSIDLTLPSTAGLLRVGAAAYFDPNHPSGGRFLIQDARPVTAPYLPRAVITDFDGVKLGEFDYRSTLGLLILTDFSAITSGPLAGAFAAVDRDGGEMVIFWVN